MANSRRRCRSCRDYFPASEMVGPFCSEACASSHRTRQHQPKKPPTKKRPSRAATFTVELKQKVRERDGFCCRWCGRGGIPLHVHHVRYRSEGGPDVESNLVLLCEVDHRKAHSDKRLWQPLLLTCLWLEYFHGAHLTIPETQRWLAWVEAEAA